MDYRLNNPHTIYSNGGENNKKTLSKINRSIFPKFYIVLRWIVIVNKTRKTEIIWVLIFIFAIKFKFK